MMNKIDIQIEDYYLMYIEGVREYSAICNTKLMDESWSNDQIINWCVEWIYECFSNILNQIIVISIPMGSLPCEMLEKLLKQMKEIEIDEKSWAEERGIDEAAFYKKMLEQNNIRLTKAIELSQGGDSSQMAEELNCSGVGRKIDISIRVREEIEWKWEWLKGMLEKQHRQTMPWEEFVQYCLIGTYTMLRGLKGGFQLRIPFSVIGIKGAEQLEDQFSSWITEESQGGASQEEIAILEQGREAIHQEIWQSVKVKLNEDRKKNKHIVLIKNEEE